jgi:hypothetical protein
VVNLQPAGKYLGEDFYRAGGVPAVMGQLLRAGLIDGSALTVNGKTVADNVGTAETEDADVIFPLDAPMKRAAGLTVLSGNLFDSAVMKLSVISDEFRARYLSNPDDPEAFEGKAFVFDGPEDYHHRIDDPSLDIDDNSILIMRGAGPVGYPGGAEVVNMRPPVALIRAGVHALPCLGDGRQSGTSGSPSILNAAPEAAVGGGLALVQTGDRIRIDLGKLRVDVLVDDAELARRREAWTWITFPRARLPGRRSTAIWSDNSILARCSKTRSNTSVSLRPKAFRATATDPDQQEQNGGRENEDDRCSGTIGRPGNRHPRRRRRHGEARHLRQAARWPHGRFGAAHQQSRRLGEHHRLRRVDPVAGVARSRRQEGRYRARP